jgi:hypothetical protein
MAEPNYAETLLRGWWTCKEAYENHWPSVVAERYKLVKERLVADFSASLAKGKSMAEVHAAISTRADEHQANKLCGRIPNEKAMADMLLRGLSDHIRREYHADIPSAASEVPAELEPISERLAVNFFTLVTEGTREMTYIYDAISIATDKHQAEKHCGDLISEKGMAERLLQDLVADVREYLKQFSEPTQALLLDRHQEQPGPA